MLPTGVRHLSANEKPAVTQISIGLFQHVRLAPPVALVHLRSEGLRPGLRGLTVIGTGPEEAA